MRALGDYKAQEDDELTFCKDAIITDVVKEDGGWQVLHSCVLLCYCWFIQFSMFFGFESCQPGCDL